MVPVRKQIQTKQTPVRKQLRAGRVASNCAAGPAARQAVCASGGSWLIRLPPLSGYCSKVAFPASGGVQGGSCSSDGTGASWAPTASHQNASPRYLWIYCIVSVSFLQTREDFGLHKKASGGGPRAGVLPASKAPRCTLGTRSSCSTAAAQPPAMLSASIWDCHTLTMAPVLHLSLLLLLLLLLYWTCGRRRPSRLPLPALQLFAEAVQRTHLGGARLAAQQQRPATRRG